MSAERPLLLVPLDGSVPGEQPLEIARAVADALGADIAVLFVSHEPIPPEAVASRARVPREWLGQVTLHHAVGHAAAAIKETARSLGAAAMLLSTHGKTRDLKVPAGHVTLDVLKDPSCPVYVVRSALDPATQSHRLRHLRRLLVPLDGSPEAVTAVGYAAQLAAVQGALLMLLHIVAGEPRPRQATAAPIYSDQSQYEYEAWCEEFVRSAFSRRERPTDLRVEIALRCGDPSTDIARYAADEDCDLIVAAWGGRLSPGRARVVRSLLSDAPCPLLFLLADG